MSLRQTWRVAFKGSELKGYTSRCLQTLLGGGTILDAAATERLHQLNDYLLMFDRFPDQEFPLDGDDLRFFEISVNLGSLLVP